LQIAGILSVAVVAMQSRHLLPNSVGDGWNVVIVWAAAKCIPKTGPISPLIETIYHTIWLRA